MAKKLDLLTLNDAEINRCLDQQTAAAAAECRRFVRVELLGMPEHLNGAEADEWEASYCDATSQHQSQIASLNGRITEIVERRCRDRLLNAGFEAQELTVGWIVKCLPAGCVEGQRSEVVREAVARMQSERNLLLQAVGIQSAEPVPGEPHESSGVTTVASQSSPGAVQHENREHAAPNAFLTCHDLAEQYEVPKGALEKRLERWRPNNEPCWREVENRGVRGARYLYSQAAVEPIIQDLRAKAGDTARAVSAERPSRKKPAKTRPKNGSAKGVRTI